MKKFILGVSAAVCMLFSAGAMAQQPDAAALLQQIPAAPVDSAVRVGKLDNGLTYYIRHNETPKGQADFFIAQKVGSVLENEEQRGLAHFLEHMCFNGTENFPGNSLIDWLETVGVKFGQNLNAYTSIDETVYNISSVPVARKGVIDSCLLILHDWADGLLLDPEEINKERGVIHEEWRRTNIGLAKLQEELFPKIFGDSRYGERLPIGLMSVVDNFEPQVLRDYYEKWYRPDQQGIIVVGDVDPDYIEAKIKEIFSPIKMPENPAPREYFPVSDNPGTIYAIGQNDEAPMSAVIMSFKQKEQFIPREYRNTVAFFPTQYLLSMIEDMLNQRLSDMTKKADCPFASARISLGNYIYAPTKDALDLEVVGKGDDIVAALTAAYREVLRAARGGFTVSEYDRAKADYIASLEKQYEQRNGRQNTSYAREYAANFTKGDPIPGIEYELNTARQLEAMIPLQAINATLPQIVGNDNRTVLVMLAGSAKLPTEAELDAALKAVDAEKIEAFKEEVKAEPLVPQDPKPVQPRVSENPQWNATELVYPNGAKVIIKPTKFKDGEIVMEAIAKGGISAIEATPATLQFLDFATSDMGLGSYNSSDLEKFLSGKQTNLSANIDVYSRELSGATTPKILNTLMQMIYMTFADPKVYQADFEGAQARMKSMFETQLKNPQVVFQKGAMHNMYKSPARQFPTPENIAAASIEETQSIISQMYSNPGDFTFTFVGDINVDSLTTLCNKYIGSIAAPRIAGVPVVYNADMEITEGANTAKESMTMAEPQVWTYITMSAAVPYTAKERMAASMAGQILSNRLLKKVREEMGATYSIGSVVRLSRMDKQNLDMHIPFPMNPEYKDQVLQVIPEMINSMAGEIKDEEFQPIQEYMVKSAIENAEKNEEWANAIVGSTLNGVDAFNGAADLARNMTKEDVQAIIKQLVDANNYRVYLLEPAK